MRDTSRWLRAAAILAAVAAALGGCATPTPGASPATPPSPSTSATQAATPTTSTTVGQTAPSVPASTPPSSGTVVISRSGGITGINQAVVIRADGAWTLTDRRTQRSTTGRLTVAQMVQLRGLLADPGFAAEARPTPPVVSCADGIAWVISANGLTARDEGCGFGNQPHVRAVITFVANVIPW